MIKLSSLSRLALASALSLAACHEERPGYDPARAVSVETAVSPGTVSVGEHVTVFCTRVNGHGEAIAGGAFTLGVDPSELVYVEGVEMFSNRSGTHHIQCNDPELGLVDASPATLEVTAGPATKTAIALNPPTITAGGTAAVTCMAQDEYGNPADANLRLEATPTTSIMIDGIASVSATKAGDYQILCFAATVDEAARAHETLTVVPGARAGMGLKLTPEQPSYDKEQQVRVTGRGVDRYGNPLDEEFPVEAIDATPAGHHRVVGQDDDKIWFDAEAIYTVTARSKADPNLTASAQMVVDQTPPVLIITAPERGIATATMESVTLTGSVSDNLGAIDELRVGDLDIPIAAGGGPFSIEVPLRYGLNLLDVHALDPYGHEAVATRALEKSSEYHPQIEKSFASDGIDNGAVMVLMPEVFDDGDHTEPVRDDLAHLFEFIVENLDIASLLPNPLTTFGCIGGDCTLEFDHVTEDDVKVSITLTPGRLHLRAELVGVEGQVTLYFPCDSAVCSQRPVQPLPGTVTIPRVTVETDVAIAFVDGRAVMRPENPVATIEAIDVSIPDPTGIGQAAIDLVITYVQEPLVDSLEGLIVDLITNELADALDGVLSALTIDERFELQSPVAGAPGNWIQIKTEPKGVDIAPERLQVRLDGIAYAINPQRPHEHPGSIGHRGCAPMTALEFPSPAPIVVGLHDDLINELLFAIWEGGTLSLNLGPEEAASLVGSFGLTDAHITVDALLPPVFDSCGADGVKTVEKVELGDLYLEASANFAGEPIKLGLWIMTEAPLSVAFAPNAEGKLELSLVVGELDPMWIEVVTNEGRFEGSDEAVIGLVEGQLIPQLLGTLTESAHFALPTIDLGSLTTAVPAGTVINLDVRAIARDNAYLTVQGAFEQ